MLEDDEKISISRELRDICDNLRQLEQDPSDTFIGKEQPTTPVLLLSDPLIHIDSVARAPLYHRSFGDDSPYVGPFSTVADFYEWFTSIPLQRIPDPASIPMMPFRNNFPDKCAIKFTHGDLHRSNIIITNERPRRIVALIDWEQSGWYPEYWEVRKAEYMALEGDEWDSKCLTIILVRYDSISEVWWWYISSIGP